MKLLLAHYNVTRQAHGNDKKRRKRRARLRTVYIGLIAQCREIHPQMGLRKMYNQLKPEGIGRDAFIILGMQEGFRLAAPVNYRRTTYASIYQAYDNLLGDKVVTSINQVWVSDLFYLEMEDYHLYIVLIMDLFSRRIVGSAGGDHMRADLFTKAMNRALSLRGVDDYDDQLIHHSDRGSQYTSQAYTELLGAHGIEISMCANVLENAHAERVNGTIKNDYLRHYDSVRPSTIDSRTLKAQDAYNDRYHDSLGCTPMLFETKIDDLSPAEHRKYDIHVFTMENTQKVNIPGQLSLFEMFNS